MAYVETMEDMIPEIAASLCFGCSVKHESLAKHDLCLTMSRADQVEACWANLLEKIDHYDVLSLCIGRLPCSFSFQKVNQLMDHEYRKNEWFKTKTRFIKELLK